MLPAETGITFVHDDGHGGKKYIMETVTAGLALFDYDGDGLLDIYFLSGAALQGFDHQVRPALLPREPGTQIRPSDNPVAAPGTPGAQQGARTAP